MPSGKKMKYLSLSVYKFIFSRMDYARIQLEVIHVNVKQVSLVMAAHVLI